MKLRRIKIGNYLELYNKICGKADLTVDDVSGINKDKEFFEPSKQVGKDTSNYKIVPPNYFACNLMHIGRDVVLPIALNNTEKDKYVSPAYTVFKIIDEREILNKYLFMLLKSNEKDRYFWFHCDSSVRDGMDWDTFCDVEIDIPPIEIQKKYVAVYESLLHNLKVCESKLEDLKLVCDGYIEKLRRNYGSEEIKDYIEEVSNKNLDKRIDKIYGISKNGFISPNQKPGDLEKYYIFDYNNFVYSPPRINVGSIGIYKEKEKAVCSPIYVVFKVKNEKQLNPDYLMIWLLRSEFLRSTDFYSMASVRNNFSYDIMSQTKICIPSIDIQNNIVKVFNTMNKRKEYVAKLKKQIQNICPILIKGSIEECR